METIMTKTKILSRLLIGALAVSAYGCGIIAPARETLSLQISTEPASARLYVDGKDLGLAPKTIHYEAGAIDAFKAGQTVRLKPVTAIWVSGAEATTGVITMDNSKGMSKAILLRRPASYPNAQLDISHAMNLDAAQKAEGRAFSQGVSNMGQRLLQNNGNW